jgi:hypothetical protein
MIDDIKYSYYEIIKIFLENKYNATFDMDTNTACHYKGALIAYHASNSMSTIYVYVRYNNKQLKLPGCMSLDSIDKKLKNAFKQLGLL